jgi:hypothetical protein
MQSDMIGVHQYPFCYVIEHYNVPARIGRIVDMDGRMGVIAADRGHYIGVLFDDCKPANISNVHPTSVKYLGLGKVRKQSRSQQRYQKFLQVGECYGSFAEFIGVRK